MPTKRSPKRQPRRSYHHGDLKAAIVDAAVDIVRKEGADALTLRAVAARVGVSAAAPYRHFADRRALVAAVAEVGFLRLQKAMLDAVQSAPGREGLKEVARAYVRFGHENSAEYRVMFGPEVAVTDDYPSLQHTGRSVLGFVAKGMEGLQQAGLIGPGDPWLMATATWATLHGLVMLSLDGQTAGVAPDLEAIVNEATRIMMFGMAPRLAPVQLETK